MMTSRQVLSCSARLHSSPSLASLADDGHRVVLLPPTHRTHACRPTMSSSQRAKRRGLLLEAGGCAWLPWAAPRFRL